MTRRSEAFYLGLVISLTNLLLITLLVVIAWRTNAMLLFRRDPPPPVTIPAQM